MKSDHMCSGKYCNRWIVILLHGCLRAVLLYSISEAVYFTQTYFSFSVKTKRKAELCLLFIFCIFRQQIKIWYFNKIYFIENVMITLIQLLQEFPWLNLIMIVLMNWQMALIISMIDERWEKLYVVYSKSFYNQWQDGIRFMEIQ